MEIIGACVIAYCLWYAQKPVEKKQEAKKKPVYTIEVYKNDS
jgi:hypothetical protein